MGGDLEGRCVGRVYGADGAVRLVLSSWGLARVKFNCDTLLGREAAGSVRLVSSEELWGYRLKPTGCVGTRCAAHCPSSDFTWNKKAFGSRWKFPALKAAFSR